MWTGMKRARSAPSRTTGCRHKTYHLVQQAKGQELSDHLAQGLPIQCRCQGGQRRVASPDVLEHGLGGHACRQGRTGGIMSLRRGRFG